jgi:Protein of unknown function (DUF1676)
MRNLEIIELCPCVAKREKGNDRETNTNVVSFVSFRRTSSESVRGGKALSENEIMSNLPAEPKEKHGRLLDLALESATNFLGSHNVQFTVPAETTKSVARAIETGKFGAP